MTKEELLHALSEKISSGEISREEVVKRFHLDAPLSNGTETSVTSQFSVNKLLYFLGAAVVVIGIITFVSQIWNDIGSLGRVVITLGLGLLTSAIGSSLFKSRPGQIIGSVFHIIGGVLIPGGALVTLNELSTGIDHPWVVASTFGVIFAFYLLLNYVHRHAVLTFFAIANGTAFVYLVVEAMTYDASIFFIDDLYAYLTMVVGASYLLLGYAFRIGWNQKLVSILYFFGITGFLGAGFSQVFNSLPWQLFYFIILMGGFFLAVYVKNRSILVMSTLFLIAHTSYITSEYFADSIGWPIALIILGFLFIGLGYVSLNLNKKYIAN